MGKFWEVSHVFNMFSACFYTFSCEGSQPSLQIHHRGSEGGLAVFPYTFFSSFKFCISLRKVVALVHPYRASCFRHFGELLFYLCFILHSFHVFRRAPVRFYVAILAVKKGHSQYLRNSEDISPFTDISKFSKLAGSISPVHLFLPCREPNTLKRRQ